MGSPPFWPVRAPLPMQGPPSPNAPPGSELPSSLTALVDLVRGATVGAGDDPNRWLRGGELLSTVIPFGPGKLRALTSLVRGEAAAAKLAAPEILAKAKALYLERGAGQSPVRMAQALKDAGYKFGPMKRAADKRAANAWVDRLMWEAEAPPSQLDPDSPFAR